MVGVGTLSAEVQVAPIFSDHAILQRRTPIPVWGTAAPDERVTVKLGEATCSAVADVHGAWMARLAAREAGGPFELTVTATNAITLHDVVVGDVWLCAGQSNMGTTLAGSPNWMEECSEADLPMIRLLHVPSARAAEPATAIAASWQRCSPLAAFEFSTAGFFFARRIQHEIGVPVGMIMSTSWGCPIEPFIDRRVLAPDAAPSAAEKAPGSVFNAQIAPLIPYALTGVLWYQGESNADAAREYAPLLRQLIASWRKAWGSEFAFLLVQLPNFTANGRPKDAPEIPPLLPPDQTPLGWARLREAQARVAATEPRTTMVATIDIGCTWDIHPHNKPEVARRLALAAEGFVYGQRVEWLGPRYEGMSVEGGKVRLRFSHLGGGLVIRGPAIMQLAVSGDDRKFSWAQARVDGDTLVAWSDTVPHPVAVRYAFSGDPVGCDLYGKEGLPAEPFRSDDWDPPGTSPSR